MKIRRFGPKNNTVLWPALILLVAFMGYLVFKPALELDKLKEDKNLKYENLFSDFIIKENGSYKKILAQSGIDSTQSVFAIPKDYLESIKPAIDTIYSFLDIQELFTMYSWNCSSPLPESEDWKSRLRGMLEFHQFVKDEAQSDSTHFTYVNSTNGKKEIVSFYTMNTGRQSLEFSYIIAFSSGTAPFSIGDWKKTGSACFNLPAADNELLNDTVKSIEYTATSQRTLWEITLKQISEPLPQKHAFSNENNRLIKVREDHSWKLIISQTFK